VAEIAAQILALHETDDLAMGDALLIEIPERYRAASALSQGSNSTGIAQIEQPQVASNPIVADRDRCAVAHR
jgi:hypothetical protein